MTNKSAAARAMTARLIVIATILVAASWIGVPAWLPESAAIQSVAAAGLRGACPVAHPASPRIPGHGDAATTITSRSSSPTP